MNRRKLSSTDHPITFPMYLTDGTPATGKTVTVNISKDGAAFGAASGAVSEIANGEYKVAGNATDRNTTGELRFYCTATGCDPTRFTIDIVELDPYLLPDVNVTKLAGQTVTCAAAVTIYPALGMTETANTNFENVFVTDFATNYDATADKWSVTGGSVSEVMLAKYVGLLARNDGGIATDLTAELALINTDYGTGGGAYDTGLHSLRMAAANVVDVKAVTDQFVFTIANQVDANALSGGGGLDAAGVRAALGMAAADMDTQLGTLATAANLAMVAGYIDTEIGDLQSSVNDLPTNSELTTALSGMATTAHVQEVEDKVDTVDTVADAIKVKTDTITDIYTAQIEFAKDTANSRDEYNVTWLKNGVPQTSGITSPTVQVVKRDATNLIASTAMTNSGSGVLIYNEATNRTTAGESYKVITVATIDAGSRTFTKWIGRDV